MLFKRSYIILTIIIIWFVLNEVLPAIDMPEIWGDEALSSIYVLKLIKNIPTPWDIVFLGKHFPTTHDGKHGCTECYLSAPFIFFIRANKDGLRIESVFLGILILILVYYFGCKFFNPIVGILSALFLSINWPFLIEDLKRSGLSGHWIPIFTMLPLLFFLKYRRSRKNIYFYLSMFLLALGYQTKGWFIWFILSLFACSFLYINYNKIQIKIVAIGLIFMLLGLVPILYCYYKNVFHIFVLNNIVITNYGGINNLEFIKNFLTRFNQLNLLLVGPYRMNATFHKFPIFFFWACVTLLICIIYFKACMRLSKRRIIFILLLLFLTLVFSSFTLTGLASGHLFILFPYVQIIMAASLFELFNCSLHKIVKVFLILLVGTFIGLNVVNCIEKYEDLKIEKERKNNCSLKTVTKWLMKNKVLNIVGFNPEVLGFEFYSDLNIKTNIIYFKYDNLFFEKLEMKMKSVSSDDVFIFEDREYKEYEIFKFLSERFNKKIVERKKFLWSDGQIRFTLCCLQ